MPEIVMEKKIHEVGHPPHPPVLITFLYVLSMNSLGILYDSSGPYFNPAIEKYSDRKAWEKDIRDKKVTVDAGKIAQVEHNAFLSSDVKLLPLIWGV